MTLGLLPLRPLDASLDGFRNDALFNVTTLMVSVLFVDRERHPGLGRCHAPRGPPSGASYERGIGRRHLALHRRHHRGHLLRRRRHAPRRQLPRPRPGAVEASRAPTTHPLEVEVLAQQWAWNIRYAGPDGKFDTRRRHRHAQRAARPGRPPRRRAPEVQGRGALVLPAELPRQAGRRCPASRRAPWFAGQGRRHLRARLRAALRRQPLQDARPRHRRERRRRSTRWLRRAPRRRPRSATTKTTPTRTGAGHGR